jgi:hypothetical protein
MVRADDSLWHSFVGEMTQHCGLSAFLTNDQIVHAVSKTPLGPWIRQGPLHPFGVSAECPHAIRGPGGEYLVFHTGCGNLSNPNSIRKPERHDCANGTTGPTDEQQQLQRRRRVATCGHTAERTSVFVSRSPAGPWEQHLLELRGHDINGVAWPPTNSTSRLGRRNGNPTAYVFANGTTLLLFRSEYRTDADCVAVGGILTATYRPGCTLVGLARAESWRGPFVVLGGPIMPFQQEDPHLYRDAAGHFHAIFHGMDPYGSRLGVGRHAFSLDGLHPWHYFNSTAIGAGDNETAFNNVVELVGGGSISLLRRERPELVLGGADGRTPVVLISGVQPGPPWRADQTFTLVQPVATSDQPVVTVTISGTAAAAAASSSSHPTIPEAQRHVRGLRTAGVTGEIVLDIEGAHPPFSVGRQDSGLHDNARTVYRGKGAKTRISGGVEIPPSLFKHSGSSANPALLTADISSLNLDPASFGEIAAAECVHTCSTTCALLSFNDEEMILARWPDFDRATGRNVYTHLKSPSSGAGSFVYAPDNATVKARVLNWAKEGGGWLHGYWQFDWADCYREIVQAELMPAIWEVQIVGQFHPTVGVNGSLGDTFRIRAVPSGGPDDPRHGDCQKNWKVATQNVLEQKHAGIGKPWAVVAPLACGNTGQKIAASNFTPAGLDVKVTFSPADITPGSNARFYATNLLSELDSPGEYFFELTNSSMKLHLIPPPGYSTDPAEWHHGGPVVGLKDPVVNMTGSMHTSLQSMQVLHGRGVGVLATDVVDVQIHAINSSLHTRHGIWLYGINSAITNCSVSAVGCGGIRAHGGNAGTLEKGNLSVIGNHVYSFARWKRTYQAGIHWAGVSNTYSHNVVTDSPHNCFLGGGNEADADSTLAGVDCTFDGNTLNRCAYEAADAGEYNLACSVVCCLAVVLSVSLLRLELTERDCPRRFLHVRADGGSICQPWQRRHKQCLYEREKHSGPRCPGRGWRERNLSGR